jgi:hypothetical protein
MTKTLKTIFCLVVVFASIFSISLYPANSKEIPLNQYGIRSTNPYVVERIVLNGKTLEKIVVPGPPSPPAGFIRPSVANLPVPNPAAGINVLTNVPASTWAFGCSATSASMMFGYYDNSGYASMYEGPANGGVFPMTNATWGTVSLSGETRALNPLSATRNSLDGRTIRGHVDDYWIKYNNTDSDPFITGSWTEHSKGECTADYMGTNQSTYGNSDGATTFWGYSDGTALYDYTDSEPGSIDGCHGLRDFVESRGYAVQSSGNFNQCIYPYGSNTKGFTFANFKAEIDAGRPVLIQVEGHTMLGFGYNDSGSTIYIHDTWDYLDHTMTWGGSYSGMKHYGVTVCKLAAVSTPTISGTIVVGGSPLAGVVMSGLAGSPTTNASGFYTAAVANNWSGTVVPTLASYVFSPVNRVYTNVTSNQTDQNYTAALPPALALTSPDGGEHWTLGATKNITWTASNYTGKVRLVLFKSGVKLGTIFSNISAAPGSYSWTVGQYIGGTGPVGTGYRLYLHSMDNTLIDPSATWFNIIAPAQLQVTSPNGGESWARGSQHAITWNPNGYTGTVRLVLFSNTTKKGQIAANLQAAAGTYLWTVGATQAGTAPAGSMYSIRLLATDGSQEDFTDSPFAISTTAALVADHECTELNGVPADWLEQASWRQRLLIASAGKDDPVTLGLRLLGSRDPRLGVAADAAPAHSGLGLQETIWQPKGTDYDLSDWRWSLERAALESGATVVLVKADEAALRSGRLDAAGYIAVLTELAERLPGVKLAFSTISIDNPDNRLETFNRQVREHVLQTDGILLDTADIESWHGAEQALQDESPLRHNAYRADCGQPCAENLNRQGAAMWWLLARLSGSEGNSPVDGQLQL